MYNCDNLEHRRCLNRQNKFTAQYPGMARTFTICSVSDIESMLEEIKRLNPNAAKIGDVAVLVRAGVCAVPLFDAFTREALRLVSIIEGGGPWPWPGTFYDQPAIFARAHEVIKSEQGKITSEGKSLGQ